MFLVPEFLDADYEIWLEFVVCDHNHGLVLLFLVGTEKTFGLCDQAILNLSH